MRWLCVCKDAGPIKHFLQPRSTDFHHTDKRRTLTGKGDTEPPVPFRKDKTQVTDVGTIALSMVFSLLFFHYSSANGTISHYSSDILYWAPVHTLPSESHKVAVYIKGVSNRPLQSLQPFSVFSCTVHTGNPLYQMEYIHQTDYKTTLFTTTSLKQLCSIKKYTQTQVYTRASQTE